MIQKVDINRAAQVYIEQYGEEALLKAMHRAEGYRAIGNDSGLAIWNKISDAIVWLQIPQDLVDITCH